MFLSCGIFCPGVGKPEEELLFFCGLWRRRTVVLSKHSEAEIVLLTKERVNSFSKGFYQRQGKIFLCDRIHFLSRVPFWLNQKTMYVIFIVAKMCNDHQNDCGQKLLSNINFEIFCFPSNSIFSTQSGYHVYVVSRQSWVLISPSRYCKEWLKLGLPKKPLGRRGPTKKDLK